MGGKGVTQGGNCRRVQVRAERKDGFTAAKQQLFLDHLAGCSNVSRAAAAVGVCVTTVHNCRRRDPAFAQAFGEAMETGYAGLEAMLLDRAARGGGYVSGKGAADAPGPETVDSELALRLMALRMRGEPLRRVGGGRQPGRVTEKELNEAILARLKLLKERKNKRARKA